MRRLFLITISMLLLVSMVFADDGYTNLSSSSKVITAYKSLITDGVPAASAELRILDARSLEIEAGNDVVLPINARGTEYDAFSWVLGGNIYTALTLGFSFGPMYLNGDDTQANIPYSVVLSHTSSRIGNTTIPEGRESTATSKIANSFTGKFFKYADSATINQPNEIDNIEQSGSVVYDMSINTRVYDVNDNLEDYAGGVCDHWNRYGLATVTMDITSDGKNSSGVKYPDGRYYANVVVSVTTSQ